MRDNFQHQLDYLHERIMYYGLMVAFLEKMSTLILLRSENGDLITENLGREASKTEMRFLESYCQKLLITQQPVAQDLNFITSSLKIIRDLDKLSELSLELSNLGREMEQGNLPLEDHLRKMCKISNAMISKAVLAFTAQDSKEAQEVIDMDESLDKEYLEIKAQLEEKTYGSSEDTQNAMGVLSAAKCLERMGDHSVNIAKWTKEFIV